MNSQQRRREIAASKLQFFPIKGYEDLYEISRCGMIRSKDRMIKPSITEDAKPFVKRGRVLSYFLDKKNGFYRVILTKDKKKHYHVVHHLMAINFLDNPNGSKIVIFRDGNKANFHVNNLQWAVSKRLLRSRVKKLKDSSNKT